MRVGVGGWRGDALPEMPDTFVSGATCVQRLDDSRNSAIHTTYRISLRSSSLQEPRYPLLRVVFVYRLTQLELPGPGHHALTPLHASLPGRELGGVAVGEW